MHLPLCYMISGKTDVLNYQSIKLAGEYIARQRNKSTVRWEIDVISKWHLKLSCFAFFEVKMQSKLLSKSVKKLVFLRLYPFIMDANKFIFWRISKKTQTFSRSSPLNFSLSFVHCVSSLPDAVIYQHTRTPITSFDSYIFCLPVHVRA